MGSNLNQPTTSYQATSRLEGPGRVGTRLIHGCFLIWFPATRNHLSCIMHTRRATLSIVFYYMIFCIFLTILPLDRFMYQQKNLIYLVLTIHKAKPHDIYNQNLAFRNSWVRTLSFSRIVCFFIVLFMLTCLDLLHVCSSFCSQLRSILAAS